MATTHHRFETGPPDRPSMTARPALARSVRSAGESGDPASAPPGGGTQDMALVAAFELLEQVQSSPVLLDLGRRIAQAHRAGWYDVEFMLHFCRYVSAEAQGGDCTPFLEPMERAALDAKDGALEATVLALRSTPDGHVDEGADARDHHLARAVALLLDGGGNALTRAGAYIACGLGYQRVGLWELEEEMYQRAEADLARPVPAALARIVALKRAVVTFNDLKNRLAQACEQVEIGRREQIRAALAKRPPALGATSGMHPMWLAECAAMEDLLAAIAGEPPAAPTPALLAAVHDSLWPCYAGCIVLADALRAADRGEEHVSVERAARAAELLVDEWMPTVYTLALSMTVRTTPVAPSSRTYIERLLSARRDAHQRQLSSARARLRAERLILENEQLTRKAYLDGLTGLANRYAFDRHRERLRTDHNGDAAAVLMLDLNQFKPINDTFGHAAGDEVLRRIAELLRSTSRPTDMIIRFGGDEFVLLLNGCDEDLALSRADLILRSIAEADWSDLTPGMTIGVTIGVAAGTPAEIDALIEDADHDMYARKAAARHDGADLSSRNRAGGDVSPA